MKYISKVILCYSYFPKGVSLTFGLLIAIIKSVLDESYTLIERKMRICHERLGCTVFKREKPRDI